MWSKSCKTGANLQSQFPCGQCRHQETYVVLQQVRWLRYPGAEGIWWQLWTRLSPRRMFPFIGTVLSTATPGVPLLRPVAGIAMGLILEPPATPGSAPRHVVLSDILGSEDALGDMDFKVAGDHDTVTAFQMDIKVGGGAVDVAYQGRPPLWHSVRRQGRGAEACRSVSRQ